MQKMQFLFVTSFVLLVWGCAQAKDDRTALARAWSDDSVIVVTVDATPREADETYGDFAYYLNEFAASADSDWAFFNHSSDSASTELALDIELPTKPYSLIFFQRGKPQAYVHQGPILEPQVYEFIQRKFEDRSMPEYLHQFSPVRRALARCPTQEGSESGARTSRFLSHRRYFVYPAGYTSLIESGWILIAHHVSTRRNACFTSWLLAECCSAP